MPYVPDRGHWIWLEFTPQSGHEQAGRRPALVLSSAQFNRASGLCFVCPVTNTRRGLRTHVGIPRGQPVTGVVLADHAKSVDYRSRRIEFIGVAHDSLVEQVTDIVLSLVDPC